MININRFKISKLISFLGVVFFSISLLLPENYRNVTLILFSFVVVLNINKISIDNNLFKLFLINSSLFYFQALSILYSYDKDDAIKRVIVMISLFIIPLFFYSLVNLKLLDLESISKRLYKYFFWTTVLFFVGVFIQNYYYDFLNEFIFRHYNERLNSKYGKYSLHPIYASLFIGLSLIFSTAIYSSLNKKKQKIAYLAGTIFLIGILLLLARKSAIITLLFIFLWYFIKSSKKRRIAYFYLTVVFIFSVISFLITPIRERYLELYNSLLNVNNGNHGGSTFVRFYIYKCAWEAISNSPLFGYGIGDAKTVLEVCYNNKESIFKDNYYNAHNQFLSVWISSGVLGFFSLLSLVVYNFKLAVKSKNFIYLSTMILFVSTMMIENVLERQNGIILTSFFINFFAFKSVEKSANY